MNYKTKTDFADEESYVRYLHQEENKYIQDPAGHAEHGIFHPFVSYWYDRHNSKEEKPTTTEKYKQRYQTCKSCENFINTTKQCKKCWCFMPFKTQFEFFKCPEGKW